MSAHGHHGHGHGHGHGDRQAHAEAMKLAQDVKAMDPETLKSHVRRLNEATPITWEIEWKKPHKELDDRKKPINAITDQMSVTKYQNSIFLKKEAALRRRAEHKLHTKFMLQVDNKYRHPRPWSRSSHVNSAANDQYMEVDDRPTSSLGFSRSRPELAPLPSTSTKSLRSKSLSKGSLRSGHESTKSPSRMEDLSVGGSLDNGPWLAVKMDQDFGPASPYEMKPSSRDRFTQHLIGRVEQIKREYEWMPSGSVSQSTFKARLGADLFEMRRCLWRMQDMDEPDARTLAEGSYQD